MRDGFVVDVVAPVEWMERSSAPRASAIFFSPATSNPRHGSSAALQRPGACGPRRQAWSGARFSDDQLALREKSASFPRDGNLRDVAEMGEGRFKSGSITRRPTDFGGGNEYSRLIFSNNSGELYGEDVEGRLREAMRDEIAFASPSELAATDRA